VDGSARDNDEIFEATVFLHHFEDLPDTRQQAKVVSPQSRNRWRSRGDRGIVRQGPLT